MSSNLEKQIYGNIKEFSPVAFSQKLVEKWDGLGMLKGYTDPVKKRNLARLLENEAVEIALKRRMLTEASETTDIKGFQSIAFSVVRRFFGGLIANEIVSVQPMSLPAGLLFYLDFKMASVKAGNMADDFAVGKSIYGDQNYPTDTQASENLGTGFLYDYEAAYSRREVVCSELFDVTATSGVVGSDVDFDPDLLSSLDDLYKLTVTSGAVFDFDPPADKSASKVVFWMPLSASSVATGDGEPGDPVAISGLKVYRKHTRIVGDNVVFIISGSAGSSVKLSYIARTKTTTDGTGLLLNPSWESDFADPTKIEIPEIDLKVSSVGVITETRKLKIRWSQEIAQDLSSFLNLDPEVELTKILSESMALEIDREIIYDILKQASAATYHWSRIPGRFLNKNTGAVHANAVDTYVARTQKEWYETLVETILDVGNAITRKTLRGYASFCVVSPEIATMLEATLPWKFNSENQTTFRMGVEKEGTLNSRITVYKDPYMPKQFVLVGYKGESFLDTGYVHAPYIPLIVTPTIFHPEDFTPRKMIMSRYANKMIRSDFYGKIILHDLDIL